MFFYMDIVLYLCYTLITNKNRYIMKNLTIEQEKEMNEIFNSDFFGLLDIESEKQHAEENGWNYENLISFGQQLGKKIK